METTINYKVNFTYKFHRGELPHEQVCEIISKVFPSIKTIFIGIDTESKIKHFVTSEGIPDVPINEWHKSFGVIFSVSFSRWNSEVIS